MAVVDGTIDLVVGGIPVDKVMGGETGEEDTEAGEVVVQGTRDAEGQEHQRTRMSHDKTVHFQPLYKRTKFRDRFDILTSHQVHY